MTINFILDLGSMYDAVQESFDLILDLQEGDMDLYSANENRSCCTTFS
jgi:hypothetical protein